MTYGLTDLEFVGHGPRSLPTPLMNAKVDGPFCPGNRVLVRFLGSPPAGSMPRGRFPGNSRAFSGKQQGQTAAAG